MRLDCGLPRFLVVSIILVANSAGTALGQNMSPTLIPKWTVELHKYGWHTPPSPSNKEFFRDITPSKLESLDMSTRIVFVSNDVVAAYHTNQEGQDWKTASRQLEAFFISTKDGSLMRRSEWPTDIRESRNDLLDSENRLIPLSGGRFVVFAKHTMMLYADDLGLLRQERLDPSTPGNLWSAQSVAAGHKMFLRHQSALEQQTTYSWLNSDTLRPLAQMSGFRGKNFSRPVTAGDDFVLTVLNFSEHGRTTGIGKIGHDGSSKIICSNEICREDSTWVVSSCCIAISGRQGIGVVDAEKGLLWSKQIPSTANANNFQFGKIEMAMSGIKFAVWITAYKKTLFDGVEVGNSPTLFLYNTTSPNLALAIPIDRQTEDFDFALSPDGRELAVFDGTRIKLYAVN